jgi:hypothetical protein
MTETPPATAPVEPYGPQPLDIEAMFPADPELMTSLEGDKRGLRELQEAARQRRLELGFED